MPRSLVGLPAQSGPAQTWLREFDPSATSVGVTLAIAAVGAVISIAFTGFLFGVANNVYHLPIIDRLYDYPQFKNDVFIQSLKYYASGFWQILEGSGRHVPAYWLFLILDFLSRFLSLLGFVYCARLLGVQSTREKIVFVAVVCFSSLMRGQSLAGGGGLFINYFTHSELANGTILFAIYFAARERIVAALTCIGLTFFINAFMGVWAVFPVGFIWAASLVRGEIEIRSLVRQFALGAVILVALAAPVLINVLSNPDFGKPLQFDYVAFLQAFYPEHFLLSATPPKQWLGLAAAVALGFGCLAFLGPRGIKFQAALCGCAFVFVIGIATPFVTGNPTILNLHLLRSGVMIHLVVTLATAALTSKWLTDNEAYRARICGPLLLAAICSWRALLPLGLVALLLDARPGSRSFLPAALRLDYIIPVLLAPILAWQLWQNVSADLNVTREAGAWRAIGQWARASTTESSIFLLPDPDERLTAAKPFDQTRNSEIFEFVSHRRVWFRRRWGAAVMWKPSLHDLWAGLVSDGQSLTALPARVAYARKRGIDYIADSCSAEPSSTGAEVFRYDALCVYQVARFPAGTL